jgi:hypothetical protein
MAKREIAPRTTTPDMPAAAAPLQGNGHAEPIPDGSAAPVPPAPAAKPKAKVYRGSISKQEVKEDFAKLIKRLEKELGMPVWLMIQNQKGPWGEIGYSLYAELLKSKEAIKEGAPCALLLDTPGGDAHAAYRIARLFQRRSSQFTVLIPIYAKSAGTLLSLAAHKLIMGRDAELGPLDVQMLDKEREAFGSALDAVQSLERLNAFSMTAADSLMQFLLDKTGKKVETLLPMVLDHLSQFSAPLLQKIDTVDYTKKSRELKVAEEYAMRLMRYAGYSWECAREVAAHLVAKYPTHGFVIDRDEAATCEQIGPDQVCGLGLNIENATDGVEAIFDELLPHLQTLTVAGRLEEMTP